MTHAKVIGYMLTVSVVIVMAYLVITTVGTLINATFAPIIKALN